MDWSLEFPQHAFRAADREGGVGCDGIGRLANVDLKVGFWHDRIDETDFHGLPGPEPSRPTPHAESVDHRDDGFFSRRDCGKCAAVNLFALLGVFPRPSCFKFRNVSPRNERQVSRASQNDDPDLRVPVELCDRTGNRLPDGHRDGVATFEVIEDQPPDRTFPLDSNCSSRSFSKFSLKFSAHEAEISPGTETWKVSLQSGAGATRRLQEASVDDASAASPLAGERLGGGHFELLEIWVPEARDSIGGETLDRCTRAVADCSADRLGEIHGIFTGLGGESEDRETHALGFDDAIDHQIEYDCPHALRFSNLTRQSGLYRFPRKQTVSARLAVADALFARAGVGQH